MEVIKESKKVRFSKLREGEALELDGVTMLKTQSTSQGNAVNLANGVMSLLADELEVTPMDAKVTVKEK